MTNVRVERDGDTRRLCGFIDGHEVVYRFPSTVEVAPRGEPFLGLALLRAMVEHEDLTFDESAPLDPTLVASLPIIQSILCLWSRKLRRVAVQGPTAPMTTLNVGVMSSFSGGVDGACTLVEHFDEVDYLLTLDCYDTGGASKVDAPALRAKLDAFAASVGKTSVFVETNVRSLSDQFGIAWGYAHGPIPCLLAAGLGFERFYMPSSYTFVELKPWGSHPVLDPLWSTSRTQIVHDGSHHTRPEKIEIVAASEPLRRQLQVCYKSQVYNCGRCPKCVRTLMVLNLLGVKDAPFPAMDQSELPDLVTVEYDLNVSGVTLLMRYLEAHGEPAVAAKLACKIRRYHRIKLFRRFRRHLLGARAIHTIRAWRGDHRLAQKLPMDDPDDELI